MMKTIAICASVSFYAKVVEVKRELAERGMHALLPDLAEELDKTGDLSILNRKDEMEGNPKLKGQLIMNHFKTIAKSDAILVVNETKHGQLGYIGANVLMEMAVAFYLKKPIFLLHPFSPTSPFVDEIRGMQPVVVPELSDLTDIVADPLSKTREAMGLKAVEEHRQGKTHTIEDIDAFIESL